jgi:hypothetical protein
MQSTTREQSHLMKRKFLRDPAAFSHSRQEHLGGKTREQISDELWVTIRRIEGENHKNNGTTTQSASGTNMRDSIVTTLRKKKSSNISAMVFEDGCRSDQLIHE